MNDAVSDGRIVDDVANPTTDLILDHMRSLGACGGVDMVKLTVRNLAANKARLALTGLAVVLGVGFVVAT